MSSNLYRLSRWCFRHRWATVAGWLLLLLAAGIIAMSSGGKTSDAVTIPGTEAQQAVTVLQAKLPAAAGASTQVVFATVDADITGGKYQTAIEASIHKLAAINGQVVAATDPFQTETISPDKHLALSVVSYNAAATEITSGTLDAVQAAVSDAEAAGVQVEFGGGVYPKAASGVNSESIGILVALIVLLVTFGSLVAGGLPILTAIVGVLTTTFAVTALASVVDIATAATSVASLLGLSCGIDYALFILSRHRGYLVDGLDPENATGRAAGTAGSSVVFAGLSVVIALCGLSVVGIPFLTTMGLTAAFTVLVALLISMTLLPAVLGLLGRRAGRFTRLPVLRRARKAARTAVNDPDKLAGTGWANWVVRRRVPVLIVGVITLAVLCIPITGMKLGLPGAEANPTTDTSRRAYDLTTAHFGPGYNGALTIVAENINTPVPAAQIAAAIGQLPGVASSSVEVVTNGIALITVVPTTGPNDQATTDLVHRIRDDRPALQTGTGATLLVGGLVATNVDVSAKLAAALPIFLITIIILAFLLLTFAFRTILVPIKSIIGFLLSAGAAMGAQVAIFQWGWGAKLIGVEPTQTLSFLPVILIAIMFGLSSDYEIFVVSRIKEQFTKTGDARRSVITGAGQSARVVTAAALIMASIFVSVLLAPDPLTKAVGFSFAVGVLIDAFLVRLTLVPAVMAIIGAKIWYHPRWYARHIPDPDIEGEKLDEKLTHEVDNPPTSAGNGPHELTPHRHRADHHGQPAAPAVLSATDGSTEEPRS